jgi:hypothetical protein
MPHITTVRDFTRQNDYNAFSVVRVHNRFVADLGGRHAWVRIRNANATLYRRVRGAGADTSLPPDGIELEYDSRLELGLPGPPDANGFYACDLTVEPATTLDKIRAHWSHPTIEYRVTYRLAVLSVVLGSVGFILGIISLVR